jgi:hypothetical protein
MLFSCGCQSSLSSGIPASIFRVLDASYLSSPASPLLIAMVKYLGKGMIDFAILFFFGIFWAQTEVYE